MLRALTEVCMLRFVTLIVAMSLCAGVAVAAPKKKQKGQKSAPAPAATKPVELPAAPTPAVPVTAAPALAPLPVNPKPADVAQRVQAFYERHPGFSAQFTQLVKKQGMPKGIERSGQVWLQKGDAKAAKPGKMRWDYPAEEIYYFSDGATLWSYERRERLAVRIPVGQSQLHEATSWLLGRGDLQREFTLKLVTSPIAGAWALELTPKRGTQVMKSLTLAVDQATFQVQGSVLVDPLGDSTTLLWREPNYDALADEVFVWSPPAGVTVKDLSQPGK
jgi:outer membrane lipoprotein carrier protein